MGNELGSGDAPSPLPRRLVALARLHPGTSLAILVLAGAVVYFTVGRLWTGEQGKATETLDAVAKGLVEGNADEVMAWVSPYFSADELDKEDLGEALRRTLRPGLITQAKCFMRRFDLEDGRATATVEVRSSHPGWRGSGSLRSEWVVVFERLGGHWQIRSVRPVRIGGREGATLHTLLTRQF